MHPFMRRSRHHSLHHAMQHSALYGRPAFGFRSRLSAAMLIVAVLLVASSGCGGGGGGGGPTTSTVTVTGTVLSAASFSPPASPATVVIGGSSIVTNADGTFSFSAPANATTAAVSATGEVSRTIKIILKANQVNNLGNIFLADTGSDYTASVTGRVVASVKGVNQPVGNATVIIGNVIGTSATDGTFTLTGLPVGLGSVDGLYGKVTATGFSDKLITADTLQFALVTGANNIGDLLIAQPSGTTPLPPYTVTGVINVAGKPGAGVTVAIALPGSASSLGQTQTDSNGNYFFWVAPATYTVTAQDSSGTILSENVTLTSLTTPVTAAVLNLSP